MYGVVVRRRGAEVGAEAHMAGDGLLRVYPAAGAADLVGDCLGAQATDPPPLEALLHSSYVRRRALFYQAAAAAHRRLHSFTLHFVTSPRR